MNPPETQTTILSLNNVQLWESPSVVHHERFQKIFEPLARTRGGNLDLPPGDGEIKINPGDGYAIIAYRTSEEPIALGAFVCEEYAASVIWLELTTVHNEMLRRHRLPIRNFVSVPPMALPWLTVSFEPTYFGRATEETLGDAVTILWGTTLGIRAHQQRRLQMN